MNFSNLSVSKCIEEYVDYKASVNHLDLNDWENYAEYRKLRKLKDNLELAIQIAIMKNERVTL